MESDILQAIQEGRELETRGGHPVRIYATDGGGGYPIHGAIWIDERWIPKSWTKDGLDIDGKQGYADLIVKPKTIELDFWINVYPNGCCAPYPTRQQADEWAVDQRIACVNWKRTITEGDGL